MSAAILNCDYETITTLSCDKADQECGEVRKLNAMLLTKLGKSISKQWQGVFDFSMRTSSLDFSCQKVG